MVIALGSQRFLYLEVSFSFSASMTKDEKSLIRSQHLILRIEMKGKSQQFVIHFNEVTGEIIRADLTTDYQAVEKSEQLA